jgi:hypothetical protein
MRLPVAINRRGAQGNVLTASMQRALELVASGREMSAIDLASRWIDRESTRVHGGWA